MKTQSTTATRNTPQVKETPLGRIAAIRKGVKYSEFEKIAPKTGLSKSDWANYLSISMKTLERYLKQHKTFEAFQAERILEIASLYRRGEAVFGSQELFVRWLTRENLGLGGVAPKQFLDTTTGILLLADELGRIEHGVFA